MKTAAVVLGLAVLITALTLTGALIGSWITAHTGRFTGQQGIALAAIMGFLTVLIGVIAGMIRPLS